MTELRFPRVNKVILSGRVANEIEMRYTPKGVPVIRFTLAFDRPVKDSTGQYQNQSYFLDIVAWSKWAEAVNNSAHKGSPLLIEGHIETRNYTDSNNINRKSVEVVAEYIQFLEARPKQESSETAEEHETEEPLADETSSAPQITNDDVPF
ncbi:MAG: single-stranded DNA-binding protein [Candidatus Cloacimonadaceae bacterium]